MHQCADIQGCTGKCVSSVSSGLIKVTPEGISSGFYNRLRRPPKDPTIGTHTQNDPNAAWGNWDPIES